MRCCARAPRVDDPGVAPPHASMTTMSASSHAHRERALRETLDAVEDVMREKLRVECAMRRGFLSMARARVGDRAAVRASGFDNGVPATLTASVRVRVRDAGDGGVELMTREDDAARRVRAIPWGGGMPSPAMRDAHDAFVDALRGVMDVVQAQRRLASAASAGF